jgi:hypothetical protein
MDLDQPPPGKVPDLTGQAGKVSVGLGGRRPWLWGLLGICLLAAVVGRAASFAGWVNAETSPSATLQNAWLTASVKVIDTITFGPLTGVTVGTPVDLSASSSAGLPVSFSSGTLPVCTVSGSTVTTLTAGTCTITASQAGSARYLAARDVSRSFRVNGVTSKAAGGWVILLAAVLLAAVAAAATLVVRRRRLRWRPPTAPDVRAVPDTGPPGLVSVRNTGTDATHTVRIEPRPGTCTITIKEARP